MTIVGGVAWSSWDRILLRCSTPRGFLWMLNALEPIERIALIKKHNTSLLFMVLAVKFEKWKRSCGNCINVDSRLMWSVPTLFWFASVVSTITRIWKRTIWLESGIQLLDHRSSHRRQRQACNGQTTYKWQPQRPIYSNFQERFIWQHGACMVAMVGGRIAGGACVFDTFQCGTRTTTYLTAATTI